MTPAKKSTQQPKQRVIAPSPKKFALFLSLHVCGMEGRNGLDTRDDKDGLVKKRRRRENVVFSLGKKRKCCMHTRRAKRRGIH